MVSRSTKSWPFRIMFASWESFGKAMQMASTPHRLKALGILNFGVVLRLPAKGR